MQIAVHPSEPVLAILHAGYGEHEVVTASTETGKIIGRVALPETFAGLVWSADGKQLFVGGGFDDRIYRFDHAGGLLSNKTTFPHPDLDRSLAGSWRTGPVGRRQDAVGRQRPRPLACPARHDRGHDPRPDPAGGRFLPVRTGLGRASQTSCTSASGTTRRSR